MILTIIIFLITLVILVVVHELGHFLVAKKFNIKVLEFGFGIPPRAWGKKIGETLVSLNWLPFGGFVRLLGEDEIDQKVLENHRSFAAQKVWKRILVVIAGVVMNLLLAWLLFYIVIIFSNFKIILPSSTLEVIIARVDQHSPAQAAGLKVGERILSINGLTTNDPAIFSQEIKSRQGQSINLVVGNFDGRNQRQIIITPRVNPPKDQGPLGIATSPFYFQEFKSLPEKILSAPIYSLELYQLIGDGFGGIITDLSHNNLHQVSKEVMGPIGIVSTSNAILSGGLDAVLPYIYFVAYLSLSLSLINVLPFPGLDGGRLVFLMYEAVTRKRVAVHIERYIHTIGLAILLALIFLVTLSDIRKLIPQ